MQLINSLPHHPIKYAFATQKMTSKSITYTADYTVTTKSIRSMKDKSNLVNEDISHHLQNPQVD